MNNNPIGVFDSGIGGLTVTKEIIKLLPSESIIYLGDTARVPYGTRSKEVVTKFTKELMGFLLKRKIKALVVACNTISSVALDEVKKLSPVPIIGVVDPAVHASLNHTKNHKIGIIGTNGTIVSGAYKKAIQSLSPKAEVISISCPLFVPIAEEGLSDHQAVRLIAKDYLQPLKKARVDTLILGCTHYPILQKIIQETLGDKITLVDSAKPTAEQLKKLLEEKELLSNGKKSKLEVFVTDAPERVYQVASRFFGKSLSGKIKKVSL